MLSERIVVIGAGIGGLVSAALLAAAGRDVTVIEKEAAVGGKARRVEVDGARIDAGPTVFTLREVFEEIFRACGSDLGSFLKSSPAEIIARHAWSETEQLDLYADPMRSEDAIGKFAGADAARGFREFRMAARRIYNVLDHSMMRQPKASWPLPLIWRIGLWRLGDLRAMRPYESLWKVLGEHFADQRLRQLFARYSTYCGSSPFDAPATLMLIAHVEARGVWLIEGGISALAEALKALAERNGARFRLGESVAAIESGRRGVSGVRLASEERIAADAVICNADPAALSAGLLGETARRAVGPMPRKRRSLSAFVWLAHTQTSGFPLSRHNVFFSPDYAAEFRALKEGRAIADPTAYVCAQDRGAGADSDACGRERLQIIVNAAATGDTNPPTQEEQDQCTQAMKRSLERCGLQLEADMPHTLVTPQDFEALFPSTGGALYGRASHGWAASFLRQGARTRIPGLYCAGGSTHPGAGVPMAALSGQLAARTLMGDHASTRRSHPVATAGGMSMRSATTDATA